MAESEEDKAVDTLIADMQATLDRLKAAQKKDVDDENGEDAEPETPPRNLKEAERVAYTRVRAHNRRLRTAAGTQSGKPDGADAAA